MNTSCPTQCNDSPLSTLASITSLLTFFLGLLFSYIALLTSTRSAPGEIARLISDLRSTQSEINRVAEYIFYDYDVGRGAHERREEGFEGWRKLDGVVGAGGKGRSESGLSGETKTDHAGTGEKDTREGDALYNEVQVLLKECITLFYEADDLLKRTHVAGPERSYSSYVIGRKGLEVEKGLCSSSSASPPGILEKWATNIFRWIRGIIRRIRYLIKKDEVSEKMARLGEQKQKLGSVQMSLFLRKSAAQDQTLRRAVLEIERMGVRGKEDDIRGVSSG